MSPRFRCLAVVSSILAVLLGAAVAVLATAGSWLVTADRPAAADALVVLSGEPSRHLYGADLYREGIARQVYITRPVRLRAYKTFDDMKIPFPKIEDLYRAVLVGKGVDARHIHFLGEALVSTVDEARAVKVLASKNSLRKLVVITSPYHVRRVKMVFRDVVPEVEVAVVATPYEPFPAQWWTDQDAARNVVLELAKLAYYLLGGRFSSVATD